jgi:hypothetical protein
MDGQALAIARESPAANHRTPEFDACRTTSHARPGTAEVVNWAVYPAILLDNGLVCAAKTDQQRRAL